eukprot:CAMPEP_0172504488 /NCGR_PEP_ID=MMETSP1066-20121228/179088_1 /TAXON_ID=671091 /ORGANISM="Coscinodiscus wailesii, Strain CCMP2513" /LENGTH=86 /DNA_ID=CAMNT_0013280691 /DNA_START=44 /DNA_END=304 /DNA_ORIENTATION=+
MSNPGGASISSEQLKSRFIGTGHADMTKYEWATNQHRDTLSSHVGHYDLLSYFAVAQNDSIGRVRSQMLEKIIQPCGPPPQKDQEN